MQSCVTGSALTQTIINMRSSVFAGLFAIAFTMGDYELNHPIMLFAWLLTTIFLMMDLIELSKKGKMQVIDNSDDSKPGQQYPVDPARIKPS